MLAYTPFKVEKSRISAFGQRFEKLCYGGLLPHRAWELSFFFFIRLVVTRQKRERALQRC